MSPRHPSASMLPALGLQVCATTHSSFHVRFWGLNSFMRQEFSHQRYPSFQPTDITDATTTTSPCQSDNQHIYANLTSTPCQSDNQSMSVWQPGHANLTTRPCQPDKHVNCSSNATLHVFSSSVHFAQFIGKYITGAFILPPVTESWTEIVGSRTLFLVSSNHRACDMQGNDIFSSETSYRWMVFQHFP